jgi:hypothetical protein
MTRRLLLLLLPSAACLRADSAREVEDLIASAASGLSAGKPDLFLEDFDRSMPEFEKLRAAIMGLTGQADLSCSIEVESDEGDDTERVLELDWILRIEPRDAGPISTRRQKTVKCQMRKTGKKWRIVAFEPLDLFAPPGGG